MYKAYHFPLKPSSSQVVQLEMILSLGKDFWNYLIEADKLNYETIGKSFSRKELCRFVKIFKASSEERNKLHTHLYQKISDLYYNSRSNAFRKLKDKKSKRLEFPKVKEKIKSLIFKEYGNGCKITGNKVKFNHLTIRFNKFEEIKGNIKTIQIKKKYKNSYTLIITVDLPDEVSSETYSEKILNQYQSSIRYIDSEFNSDNDFIGIDAGIEKLLVCSNGMVVENPKHIKKCEKDIKRLKDKLKGQQKGSNRYNKTLLLLEKKHEKVKNIRKDFLHRISKELVLTCGTGIIIEDLNIAQMQRSKKIYSVVKKYISDASWGHLYFFVEYKCAKYGKVLIKVKPEYTSQTCYHCGDVKEKELGERTHNCEKCGFTMDRDQNSALVIRAKGLGTSPHVPLG